MSVNTGDILVVAEKHISDPTVKYIVMIIKMKLQTMKQQAQYFACLSDIVDQIQVPGSDFSFSHTDTVGNEYNKANAVALELIGVLVVFLNNNFGENIEY